jgi:hypothetical protein
MKRDRRQDDSPVMLRVGKHLEADGERHFAAAQGDSVKHLRLLRIRADLSAVGAINRPYSRRRVATQGREVSYERPIRAG